MLAAHNMITINIICNILTEKKNKKREKIYEKMMMIIYASCSAANDSEEAEAFKSTGTDIVIDRFSWR